MDVEAKISMLRLNIGSPPPWTDEVRLSLSIHELSLSMPGPMLSLSMLILAKSGQARSKS